MGYSARITKNFENITRDEGYSARSTKNSGIVQEVHFDLII